MARNLAGIDEGAMKRGCSFITRRPRLIVFVAYEAIMESLGDLNGSEDQ